MTFSRTRQRLAATLTVAAVALAGCSLPGQEGTPGVAATYKGHVVTNADINDANAALVSARAAATREQILLGELLRPSLLEIAAAQGSPISRTESERLATELLLFNGIGGEPSEALINEVEGAYALGVIAVEPGGPDLLLELALDAQEHAVLSPRSGVINPAVFLQSTQGALSRASSSDHPLWFLPLNNVTGLTPIGTPWIHKPGSEA